MKIRKVCVRKGHRWSTFPGYYPMPFQFCTRFLCDGERVNPDYDMPDEIRVLFEQVLMQRMREENKKQ